MCEGSREKALNRLGAMEQPTGGWTRQTTAGEYRPDIDGLRAVAVLPVLLFHFGVPGFSGGFVGVDVFFVISGFLITGIIRAEMLNGSFSFAAFYVRRARRILPALFATIAVTVLAAALLFSPQDFERLGKVILATLGFSSNIFFWKEAGYFDVEAYYKPLLHTWSLAVEEQYYFVWPVILLLFMRAHQAWAAPMALLAMGLSSLALNLGYPGGGDTMFYLLPFRFYELAIGAGVVWLMPYRPRGIAADLAVAAGLALIFLAVATFEHAPGFRYPSYLALLPCLGAALVIWGGPSQSVSRLISNAPAVWIGLISYSLYLVHWPIYVAYRYYYGPVDFSTFATLVMIALSFTLAVASYMLVEMPFRKRQVSIRWLLPAGVALGVIAIASVLGAGLPSRIALISGKQITLDVPIYGGEECVPRCESNPGASITVYVIGDSHLRAYYEGLRTEYPQINFIVHEYGGCEFYSDRYYGDTMVDVDKCLRMREEAWREIEGTTNTVILGQHWYANFTETQISRDGFPPHKFHDFEHYVNFVTGEIIRLRSRIKGRFIVMGGIPKFTIYTGGYAKSPYDCVTRPLLTADCAATDEHGSVQVQHREINDLFAQSLPTDIEFIDPFQALCDRSLCRNFDGGSHSLYSDSAHLSMEGSRFVIGKLTPELHLP